MGTNVQRETPKYVAKRFLRSVILAQRVVTDELTASRKEVELLLTLLAAGRAVPYAGPVASRSGEYPDWSGSQFQAAWGQSTRELSDEAIRGFETQRQAVYESISIRQQSQMFRASLRNARDFPAPLTPASLSQAAQALTKRQKSVLDLIVKGQSSKEIAAELGITFKTAVTHRANIMSKLNVHELASLVREAIRRGLV